MKYNEENLDMSTIETSPEPEESSLNFETFFAAFVLFSVVCILLWIARNSNFDLSTSSDIGYKMPLREIVLICNGFDINYFVLPASILMTWALVKLKLLKLIRILFGNMSITSYRDGRMLMFLLVFAIFLLSCIFDGIVSTCYIDYIKKKNAENASEPYVMNVSLEDNLRFPLKDRGAYVKDDGDYEEYFSKLQNTQNKRISLVVRDGSRGLPIIDAYKIIYNSDESVELDMPETVEEFYKKF